MQSSDDVDAKWVNSMKTEGSSEIVGYINEHAKAAGRYKITLLVEDPGLNTESLISTNEEEDFTEEQIAPQRIKRKSSKELSNGPSLTEADEQFLVDKAEKSLIEAYKDCQTSKKTGAEFDDCIDKAQKMTEQEITSSLNNEQKCGGAELEKCKDRIQKKAVSTIPFSIPVEKSYSGVMAAKYGNVRIGMILAKHFDGCYHGQNKIALLLKCLKEGEQKSPINVAFDKIAEQLEENCTRDGTSDCRSGLVNYVNVLLHDSIKAILEIYCKNKETDNKCLEKIKNIPADYSKGFDISSNHQPISLEAIKTTGYGDIELGKKLSDDAAKCKKEKSSVTFIECLSQVIEKSSTKKSIAEGVSKTCKGNEKEDFCRQNGKTTVEKTLKEAVNALLTNYCGKTYKKERLYQSCLMTNMDQISKDVQLPAAEIDFEPELSLKPIVTEKKYGAIAIGSIIEKSAGSCVENNKKLTKIAFSSCLGDSNTAALKGAMEEISKQLASHCAKSPKSERECRNEGESSVEFSLEQAIKSLILMFCKANSPKYQFDYDTCIDGRISVSKTIAAGFEVPFKFLDEVPLSEIIKDENGRIEIGATLKKEADLCKTPNPQTRDQYFNCLKGKPLQTALIELAEKLAAHCGKGERTHVKTCRTNGKAEVEAKLKNSIDAVLTNFCRETFPKAQNEYKECLNFDGAVLEPLSKIVNFPATIYAPIDMLKFKTSDDHGDIKIGEVLQNSVNSCKGKTALKEYFECIKGADGAQTSPWLDVTGQISKELADLCGQKQKIKDCRNTGRVEVKSELKEAVEALLLNFCGQNAASSQQVYDSCTSDGDSLGIALDKVIDLPISIRQEVSLPSLVIAKYGDIRIGEIVQNQAETCKNMKTFDEIVDCLKTSKGSQPSPSKSARDSVSEKFADFAIKHTFGDGDWKKGVAEVQMEFEKTIQAVFSNFCRENVNYDQDNYVECLDDGLKRSQEMSREFSPIDLFLQCGSKTTIDDFNQCIDGANSHRLSLWTVGCASIPRKKECIDEATESSRIIANVAKIAAKLVSCEDTQCVQTEKQKVTDSFAKNIEKYCKVPCKDSEAKVEAAMIKLLPDCSAYPENLKCRAGFSLALKEDVGCQSLPKDFEVCDEFCGAMERTKVDDGFTPLEICLIVLNFIAFLCLCCIIGYKCRKTRKSKKPATTVINSNETNLETGQAVDVKLTPGVEKKEEKIDETGVQEARVQEEGVQEEGVQDGTPALGNNPELERMRDKLKQTQDNLRLLRTHANKCAEEHKKDLANKFTPMGPIYIPSEPEVPPPADIPSSNISLTNVAWKDSLNELWEVGSDVDDIELDPDFVLNPDSVTEDETSQKSGKSKSSSKSKSKESKNSKKSKKVPSTSGTGPSIPGRLSVSAPALIATAAEKPNASETKKEQSKSKSKSRESSAEPKESSASSSVPPENEPSTSGFPSGSAPVPSAPAGEKPNASETKKEQNKSKE
ncbi:hypothetical protein GCK72_015144 [Caenorhabditis remanei]|uniref:Uncharacterized protein n=1 Tax=Caenorhabditis remanei TaxID=31234 RepID=A0A6A5GVK2_CAERE|nr:hypothetical protein GCK72_015144 [Caenorhabditis remanei]KAF1758684.1 hypothetical protein GCK72_015144 [Caenorhabditis remanei]